MKNNWQNRPESLAKNHLKRSARTNPLQYEEKIGICIFFFFLKRYKKSLNITRKHLNKNGINPINVYPTLCLLRVLSFKRERERETKSVFISARVCLLQAQRNLLFVLHFLRQVFHQTKHKDFTCPHNKNSPT